MNNNYKGENLGNSYNNLQISNSPYKPSIVKQDNFNNHNQAYSHQYINNNSTNTNNSKKKPSFKLPINEYTQSNNVRSNPHNRNNGLRSNYNGQYENPTVTSNIATSNMVNSHSSGNGLSQSLKSNSVGYNKSLSTNDGKVIADKNFKTLKNNTINASPISPHK